MPNPPALPDVAETGAVLATVNDWRAILIGVMFLFVAFIAFVVWREILNWKLTKSLDKMSDALLALRIVIVESIAEGRGRASYQDRRQDNQDTRQSGQDTRQNRQDTRLNWRDRKEDQQDQKP